MARTFLSHSSKNNPEALAVRDWLIEGGWDDLFLDLDPERGLVAGERWQEALKNAAHRCEFVLFLVSPAWAASKWCLAEFLLAKTLGKRVFGIMVEPTPFESLPTEMTAEWQMVDLTAGDEHRKFEVDPPGDGGPVVVTFTEEGLARLKQGLLQAGLDARTFVWPPKDDPDRSPYRDLRPLESEDAGIFFGRDDSIVAGIDALRQLREAAPPRFFVILGASGAGKSSFMRAGLLPRLTREDRFFCVLPVVRPEQRVLSGEHGLVAVLERALKNADAKVSRASVKQAVEGDGQALVELLKPVARPGTDGLKPTLLLPIDQGEELFRPEGAEEADRFLRLLRRLLEQNEVPVLAMCTIRSDNYERLQSAEPLDGIVQRTFSLPPMPKGTYSEVILGPTRRMAGDRALRVEDALVSALLRDIESGGAKDALPLLAFILERLYFEYGGDGDLTLEEYEAMGRMSGALTAAVDRAFQAADGVPAIPTDRKARELLLRRGLIPWLAGIDPDTGAPRRRVARRSEIPDEALPLMDLLVDQRLLATDVAEQTGEITVEPAHEALLRRWTLLEGWLEEDFEDLTTLEGVRRAARDWAANAKGSEWLSHSGTRLEQARKVADRIDFAGDVEPTERAYLEACSKRDRDEAAKKAQAERARRRSAWTVAGISLVAAVVAGGLGLAAYKQGTEAKRARVAVQKKYAEIELDTAFEARASHDTARAIGKLNSVALMNVDPNLTDRARRMAGMWLFDLPQEVSRLQVDDPYDVDFLDDERFYTVTQDVLPKKDTEPTVWTARVQIRSVDDATEPPPAMVHPSDPANRGYAGDFRLSVSKDRKRLLTVGYGTLQQWRVSTGKPVGRPLSHPGVRAAVWSEDGSMFASLGADVVKVWDAKAGQLRFPPVKLEAYASDFDVSLQWARNDERLLLLNVEPPRAIDLATGEWATDFKVPAAKDDVSNVGYDGPEETFNFGLRRAAWVASNDLSRVVRLGGGGLFDARVGRELELPSEFYAKYARFSADGSDLMVAAESVAGVLDANSGALKYRFDLFEAGPAPVSVNLSEHGIIGFQDSTAKVFLRTGEEEPAVISRARMITAAQFIDQGTHVLTRAGTRLRVSKATTGERVHDALEEIPLDNPKTLVRLSPDERLVLVGRQGGDITVLRRPQKSDARITIEGLIHAESIAVSGDEKVVVARTAEGVELYGETGQRIAEINIGGMRGSAISEDGRTILTWATDQARLWSMDGKPKTPPLRHPGLRSAALSSDGARVFTFGQQVLRWDTAKEPLEGTLMHEGEYWRSEDGLSVLWAAEDGGIRIMDLQTDRTVRVNAESLPSEGDKYAFFRHARWLAVGTRVVTYGDNFHTPVVWDSETGKMHYRSRGATELSRRKPEGDEMSDTRERVWARWVRDDRLLIWGGVKTINNAGSANESDGFVEVWNPTTPGDRIMKLTFSEPVLRAELSADGRALATRADDKIEVWSVPAGHRIFSLKSSRDEAFRRLFSGERLPAVGFSPNLFTVVVQNEKGGQVHRLPRQSAGRRFLGLLSLER